MSRSRRDYIMSWMKKYSIYIRYVCTLTFECCEAALGLFVGVRGCIDVDVQRAEPCRNLPLNRNEGCSMVKTMYRPI